MDDYQKKLLEKLQRDAEVIKKIKEKHGGKYTELGENPPECKSAKRNRGIIGSTVGIKINSTQDPCADAVVVLSDEADRCEEPAAESQPDGSFRICISGPEWIDAKHGEREQLGKAYYGAMELAHDRDCSSIVLPCFYSGISGYLTDPAIAAVIGSCKTFLDDHRDTNFDIILSVADDEQYEYVNRNLQWFGVSKYKIADRKDLKIEEMPEKQAVFELEGTFTDKQMSNLRRGHIPLEMEDKWFWFMEGDTLYAHRSWSGFCIYKIEFGEKTHRVSVNRDPEQYKGEDLISDAQKLIGLLDLWTQDEYDYYGAWITETYYKLKPHLGSGTESEAYKKALSYFAPKRGLENDFIFPADLLDELLPWERPQIEDKIIRSALSGDERFYNAVSNIRSFDLSAVFTGERMADLTGQKRTGLLYELYCATCEPVYLKNIVYMMPADNRAVHAFSRILESDDWWEDRDWETPEIQELIIALKAIVAIRGSNGKSTKWLPELKDKSEIKRAFMKAFKKLPFIDREQLDRMADIGNWKFKGWEKYSLFWENLKLKMDYEETADSSALERIIRCALINSEVYDILHAMRKDGTVTEDEIMSCLGPRRYPENMQLQ